jgi:hypothetical protein
MFGSESAAQNLSHSLHFGARVVKMWTEAQPFSAGAVHP